MMSDWEDDYDAGGVVIAKPAGTVQISEWRPKPPEDKENVHFGVKRGRPAFVGKGDQDGPQWRNWRDKADTCSREFSSRNGERDGSRRGRSQTGGEGSGSSNHMSFVVDNSVIGRVIGKLKDLKVMQAKLAFNELSSLYLLATVEVMMLVLACLQIKIVLAV